ncbi:uncharacterized protein Lint-1 isoform X2 [Eurosta solidaginis]|uniref:uncharacterized protein Lint-1 isoform X2 n=1 Tax=Eurosta solidaginis TaxID=178769 RepID=UPI003530F41D
MLLKDPVQKQRILDEIESEIYEINAEQHFLFLRLRRIMDEFYKMLKRNDVQINNDALNALISREVVPLINDLTIEVLPATVLFRNTEQKLIEKYFEVQNEKTVYEIEDSEEETNLFSLNEEVKEIPWTKSKNEYSSLNEELKLNETSQLQDSEGNINCLSQMSLLKPISQRIVQNSGAVQGNDSLEDASKFLQMNLVEDKNVVGKLETNCADVFSSSLEQQINIPVSKNVKISRLNLRQALNKARTENMVAKAAASLLARSTTSTSVTQTIDRTVNSHVAKKYDIRPRIAKHNAAMAISKERNVSELNSSSEDSNPERLPTPPQTFLGFMEVDEQRTLPEHYGQEMFLRIFQLFTPNVLVQMQQRRSKRKRRNVHSNERADFHYGRIEYGTYPPPEKKRKEFLLSPEVKRVLQSRRPKRGNAEKNEDAIPSRSSSSSPDEKRYCNECLKNGGCFEQCTECKCYYHQLCHKEENYKGNNYKGALVLQSKQRKLCPACRRLLSSTFIKAEGQQYKTLHCTAQELQKKLEHERDRRISLQQESKMYKLQMRNLFNIVNTIKSDQENDSSG